MKTIHKFQLKVADFQVVEIKGLTRVLSVEEQYNEIVLYATVDTEKKEIHKLKVEMRGTGHDLGEIQNKNSRFINTVKLQEGRLMFHVFVWGE